MADNLWSLYVRRLIAISGHDRESDFLRGLTVQQGTFNRWKNGEKVPTNPAAVALFAKECGRNVLEAFVAAGMLTRQEAGRGLPVASARFLDSLTGDAPAGPIPPEVIDQIVEANAPTHGGGKATPDDETA